MDKKLLLAICAGLMAISLNISAQCTPGDSLSCPDPEGNGQICPDTFPAAIVNVPYSVVATILPPPSFTYMSTQVPIHHITLKSVDNLPPGLTYAANVSSGEFYPGTYYCVLLSGTPTAAGTYQLKIKVDAYILFLGNPVYVGEQTDSTSLAITVQGSIGIPDYSPDRLTSKGPIPNPYNLSTSIGFGTSTRGKYTLQVFDLTGKTVYNEIVLSENRITTFDFNGEALNSGLYFYTITGDKESVSGKLIKK